MRANEPGFLAISHAVIELRDGMYGGINRPDRISEIKRKTPRLSVGFGPWREKAAEAFRDAAVNGEIAVYAVTGFPVCSGTEVA